MQLNILYETIPYIQDTRAVFIHNDKLYLIFICSLGSVWVCGLLCIVILDSEQENITHFHLFYLSNSSLIAQQTSPNHAVPKSKTFWSSPPNLCIHSICLFCWPPKKKGVLFWLQQEGGSGNVIMDDSIHAMLEKMNYLLSELCM